MTGVVLDRVCRRFGTVTAVDEFSLGVASGEFVTLLGPSGCGKTTTLRMVAGLEHNTAGRIAIGERIVSDAERGLFVPAERRQLGMVFQSYAIWPHMTVFENVAYPLRVRHRKAAEIRERVGAALRLVEMAAYAERPAPALSGGQQQRVAIARALVFEPALLLLDEPLSNLDAKLRAQMGGEFRALQRRLGITSLYVTHDQEEALALSDRVVVMQAGRILQIGAPEEIYRRPLSRAVAAFFGSPNLLPARVVGAARRGDGSIEAAVEGDGWRGVCPAGEIFAAGQAVLVMIRPEAVRVQSPGGAAREGEIAWTGRITAASFLGARRALTLMVNGAPLHAEVPAAGSAEIGEDAMLAADAADAWVLPA